METGVKWHCNRKSESKCPSSNVQIPQWHQSGDMILLSNGDTFEISDIFYTLSTSVGSQTFGSWNQEPNLGHHKAWAHQGPGSSVSSREALLLLPHPCLVTLLLFTAIFPRMFCLLGPSHFHCGVPLDTSAMCLT